MPIVDSRIFEQKFARCPKAPTEEILKLCADIVPSSAPITVRVLPEIGAEVNTCFQNVMSKIDRSGGKILYGWSLWEWPRVFIEAEHHAIWASGNTLIDITPHEPETKIILFLPDPSRHYDFKHDKRLLNRRASLKNLASVETWFQAIDDFIQYQEEHSMGLVIDAPMHKLAELQKAAIVAQAKVYIELARATHRKAPCFCGSGRKFAVCCFRLIDCQSSPGTVEIR